VAERKRVKRDEPRARTSVRNLRLLPNIERAETPPTSARAAAMSTSCYDLERDTVVVVDIGTRTATICSTSSGRARCACWSPPRAQPALEATYAFLASVVVRANTPARRGRGFLCSSVSVAA
jgi:hypothetical protein